MVPHPNAHDRPAPHQIEKIIPLSSESGLVQAQILAPYIHETRIRRGDTLAIILQRLGVNDAALQSFITRDPRARPLYKLYPGRSIQAATNRDGQLVWLRYLHTPGAQEDGQSVTRFLQVTPTDKGYTAKEVTQKTELQIQVAAGTIQSSLFAATDTAGIPDSVTMQIADILRAKVDFLRNLQQGDQFRVVYEARSHNGRYAGAGRVLALEFKNQSKLYTAVWFVPPGSTNGAYYDFNGTSLRSAFLRTALKFSRISSTFGRRKHPLHQTWMNHNGVDYAAPLGTPIHSTADGIVEFAGVKRGYGKVVIIKNSSQFSTLYAHQSHIAPGIKKGVAVSQGEIIGQVGMTGWATGPHLHYEFRIQGKPVDPLSVELPVVQKLTGKKSLAFAQITARYKSKLNTLAEFQQWDGVPLASTAND
jgi:murein DD-endopeptidase MepM/ murein hydrolase activator NlpD